MPETLDAPGEDQIRALRRLTPSQRLEAAMMLYWSARQFKLAVLRQDHPQKSEQQLNRLVSEAFMYARD